MKNKFMVCVTAAVLLITSGCASYVPPVESVVMQVSPGILSVDSRSDSNKVTRGEAQKMSLYEVAKYVKENNMGNTFYYEERVEVAYNQFIINGVAKVVPAGSEQAFHADLIIRDYNKWLEKEGAKFKSKQQKDAILAILGGAAIGMAVHQYNK